MDLGALAEGLGCFPFDHEAYPPQSDSRSKLRGIRSLVGFGKRLSPLAHPVLYPRGPTIEASPKAISERTSYPLV